MASNSVIVPPMPPVPQGATNAIELREIKGPVEIANLWPYIIAALLLTVAAAAIYTWVKRKQKPIEVPKPPPIPPHVLARQRLEAALKLLHDPRAVIFATSDAVRFYLEDFFQLRAPERTTEEFLVELQESRSLTSEQKRLLSNFLSECDLVKFAGHEPTEASLRELYNSALKLVEETSMPVINEPVKNA